MTKSKIYDRPIVVAGATGKQGGAVAKLLLSRGHRVRALTRDPNKDASMALVSAGAEVVQADLEKPETIERALSDGAALFSVQDFLEAGVKAELRQGTNLTQTAAVSGIEHVIYTGASTIDRNTGVAHLESKWRIEQQVRKQEKPWTIFRPGAFMDNWEWDRESILKTGKVRYPFRPDTQYRQVAVEDIAAMVVNAFERPDIWIGQVMPLVGDVSTMLETTEALSRVTGRDLVFEQMTWDECVAEQGEELMTMYRYFDTFGMDGAPAYMHRWHPYAKNFAQYLTSAGWGNSNTK